jgi:hypothetical protein
MSGRATEFGSCRAGIAACVEDGGTLEKAAAMANNALQMRDTAPRPPARRASDAAGRIAKSKPIAQRPNY